MRPTALKSSIFSVSPIPSMEAASAQKIQGLSNQSIVCGQRKATTERPTSQTV